MPESIEDGENFGKGDTCFTTCIGGSAKVAANDHEITIDKINTIETEKKKLNDMT